MTDDAQVSAPKPTSWIRCVSGGLGLLFLVVLVADRRAALAESTEAFARHEQAPSAFWLWKSDPAMLATFVEDIAEAEGGVPARWSADDRFAHPEPTDVAAEFTVAQEFLVAWCWKEFWPERSLERVALDVSSLLAASALLGAAWAVWSLTGSFGLALLASLVFATSLANHRTFAFLLMREDLAWPLWSLHFGAFAAALRRPTFARSCSAGLFLAGALATWHASQSFFAIEVSVLAVAALFGFRHRTSWAVCLAPALAALAVPVLRSSGFGLSPAFLAFVGLSVMVAWRREVSAVVRGVAVASLALVALGVSALVMRQLELEGASYEHVTDVLLAKLTHLGQKPIDPSGVSFDARLLWQGPFDGLTASQLADSFGAIPLVSLVLLLGLALWQDGEHRHRWSLAAVVVLGSFVLAWLIGRTVVLAGWLLPVACCVALSRLGSLRRVRVGLAVLLLGGVAYALAGSRSLSAGWYLPREKPREYAELFHWVRTQVDPTEAVACDFVNGTALVYACGNPIALHPKYETRKSRRRAEEFFHAFYFGTPAELHAWCVTNELEHLWVDRYVMEYVAPWVGGVHPERGWSPDSAAAHFLSRDDSTLTSIEGFELLYRSPPTITQSNGAPYDLFRWFRIVR